LETKKIIFLGDSFTWGEGLELYNDNSSKWKSERNVDNNNWLILKDKQDEDSINFRNNHRYPYLVSKQLNCDYFMDSENGGTLARNFKILENILIKENGITDIIIQFSTLSREPVHLNFNCSCDFCLENQWPPILDNLNRYINKNLYKDREPTDIISETENSVFNYVSSKIQTSDIRAVDFLIKSDNFVQQNFIKQLDYRINFYLKNLESEHNINFHFIDSWCGVTSNLIQTNTDINRRLIQLIGKNGKKYNKWSEWIETFKNKSIKDDYPNTNNGHPTLEMHKYLAKSIVDVFSNKKNNFYNHNSII
jgi:hypothetical protein